MALLLTVRVVLQDCDSAEYVRLVEALAQEHSINIIKVCPRPVSPHHPARVFTNACSTHHPVAS